MSGITVVNSRTSELRKLGYASLQDWLTCSPNNMYVGRDMTHAVPGAVHSKWHNPFKVAKGESAVPAVAKYKVHIRNSSLYNDLHELKDKSLACWCYPGPCHATALKELYEERYPPQQQQIRPVGKSAPDTKDMDDFPTLGGRRK